MMLRRPWSFPALVAWSVVMAACGSSGDRDGGGPPTLREELGVALTFEEVTFPDAPAGATAMAFVPGTDDELFLALREGTVLHLRIGASGVEELGSFEVSEVALPEDCGLVSIAFDPAFDDNRWVYLGQCFTVQETGIVRMTVDFDDLAGTSATAVEVLRLTETRSERGWHNVGHMRFDESGAMLVTVGDKGQSCNAQDPANDFGAVLRLRPLPEGGNEAPDDNPYVADDARADRVWAHGFRSPWASRLDEAGRLWVADVGNRDFEEVSLIDPGRNYGWPRAEGPCLDTGWPDHCDVGGCEGLTDPVVHWDRSASHPYVLADPDANTIELARAGWVGASYPGALGGPDRYEGALDGAVLFGDLCVGFVRALDVDGEGRRTLDAPVGHLTNAVASEVGPDGYVYFATYGRCGFGDPTPPDPTTIYRLVVDEGSG